MKEKSAEFAEFPGRRMNGSFLTFGSSGVILTRKSRMRTVRNMIVDSAYISGLIPFLTSLYIFVDSVSIPGPFVKWVITKSSSDIVNASRNPEKIPGMISGRTTFLNA